MLSLEQLVLQNDTLIKKLSQVSQERDELSERIEGNLKLMDKVNREVCNLRDMLNKAHSNDMQGMKYLQEIRQAVHFEGDFLSLVEKLKEDYS